MLGSRVAAMRVLVACGLLSGCGSRTGLPEAKRSEQKQTVCGAPSPPCADPDVDGDGHDAVECGGDDCNDRNRRVHPGAVAPPDATGITLETLDPLSVGVWVSPGYDPTIAVDSSGALHAASLAGDVGSCVSDLRYGTDRSGAWSFERVDTNADAAYGESIAADAAGHAHITYQLGCRDPTGAKALKYATNASGRWVIETVDSDRQSAVGWYDRLALDAEGFAHIVYTRPQSNELAYATNRSGAWVVTVLASSGDPTGCSIAIDAACAAHVAYSDGTAVRYLSNASGTWTDEPIDVSPSIGAAIAVHPNGSVVVAYIVRVPDNSGELRLATRDHGPWRIEPVVRVADSGPPCRLGLDRGGNAHIAWTESNNLPNIRLATQAASGWQIETVVRLGGYYPNPDLAVDGSAFAFVAYLDAGLQLARRAPDAAVDWSCNGVGR